MTLTYALLLCSVAGLIIACATLFSAYRKLERYCFGLGRRVLALEQKEKEPAKYTAPTEKLERAFAEGMGNIFSYTIETARQGAINDVDE